MNDWDMYQKDIDNGTATPEQARKIRELDEEKGYTRPTDFQGESWDHKNIREHNY